MIYDFFIEVIEAKDVPMARRGGRPDPLLVIECPNKNVNVRTACLTANNRPAWNQTFHLEGLSEVETFNVALYDREISPSGKVAETTFQMGGPMRSVGSRWLQLSITGEGIAPAQEGVVPSVHIVWRTEGKAAPPPKDDGVLSMAALAPNGEKAGSGLSSTNNTAPGAIGEGNTGEARQQDNSSNQEVVDMLHQLSRAIRGLEVNFVQFQTSVERRLGNMDSRMLEIETALSIRNSYSRSTAETSLERQSAKIAAQREARQDTDLRTSAARSSVNTSTDSIPTQPQEEPVNVRAEAATIGALASIRAHPTKVSAEDQKMIANYTYHQVKLPGVNTGDHVAPREKVGDNLDRRIQATSMAMDAEVRSVTATT